MSKIVQNKKQFMPISKTVASCSMVSPSRFQVKTSSFNSPLIDAFKSIPSKQYDPKTKNWTFSHVDYKNLLMKMNLLRPDIIVEPLPFYIQSLFEHKVEDIQIDSSRFEEVLWNKLYPFQKEGVRFGIEKDGKCMIADEMGLGKTLQALALASYYRNDWPLLIATTASVKNTWYEKCIEYLPSIPTYNIVCMTSTKDYMADAKILIITHNVMEKCLDKLKNRFGVIVMDESHTLKNFKAKCTSAALILAKSAKRVILLTGTPALSRPSELYTQLSMLDEKYFINFKEYSKRYCDGKPTNFGWDSSGCSNLNELNIVLNKRFMIRRTKDAVLPELNQINREVIVLESKLIVYNEKIEEDLNMLAEIFTNQKVDNEHAALLTYFSDTAKYKYKAVCSYIKELINNSEEKILVFAHHKIIIEALCDMLNDEKIYHIKIDGNIKSEVRTKLVENFQNKQACRAAVLSITSANAGITLTAAQLVIFAELHWTPSIMAQAEARAHRIGQIGSVRVQYLIAKGTADDIIWPMLQNKQGVLNEIGLCKDNYGEANTKQVVSKNTVKQKEKFKNYFSPSKEKNFAEKSVNDKIENEQTQKNAVKCDIEKKEHAVLQEILMDDDDDIFMNVNLDF